jgi:hypothetical protein
MMDDETRDPVTGRTAVVVWTGTADHDHTCFSLIGEINQAKEATDQRTRGATMAGYVRSNGPTYRGTIT